MRLAYLGCLIQFSSLLGLARARDIVQKATNQSTVAKPYFAKISSLMGLAHISLLTRPWRAPRQRRPRTLFSGLDFVACCRQNPRTSGPAVKTAPSDTERPGSNPSLWKRAAFSRAMFVRACFARGTGTRRQRLFQGARNVQVRRKCDSDIGYMNEMYHLHGSNEAHQSR